MMPEEEETEEESYEEDELEDIPAMLPGKAFAETIKKQNDPIMAEIGMLTELDQDRIGAIAVEEAIANIFRNELSKDILANLKRHFVSFGRKGRKENIQILQTMHREVKKKSSMFGMGRIFRRGEE
jgi:hypothetical protein